MFAALYGDAGLVRQLLAAGADPNMANAAGATALMWAVPDVDKLRVLLDAGADVNAHSEENRTALVIAAGIVGARPAVKLLLDYGAAAWAPLAGSNPGPLREAARVDSPEPSACCSNTARIERRVRSLSADELFRVRQAGWEGRFRAACQSAATRSRVEAHVSRSSSTIGQGHWRDIGYSGGHPRGGRAKSARVATHRHSVHQEDRLRVVPSQLGGVDGGRRGHAKRLSHR